MSARTKQQPQSNNDEKGRTRNEKVLLVLGDGPGNGFGCARYLGRQWFERAAEARAFRAP